MNIIELSKKAQAYYESLKANIVQGWEKYVATDGEQCIFVKSDYEPRPGEAVFFLVVRNKNVMCQLYKAGDSGRQRYTIESVKNLYWTAIDTHTGVSITYLDGAFRTARSLNFDEKLDGTILKDLKVYISDLEKWVDTNYPVTASCNIEARKKAIWAVSHESFWLSLADALNGFIPSDKISLSSQLVAEAEDYLDMNNTPFLESAEDKNDFIYAIESLEEDVAKEVIDIVRSYWESTWEPKIWARDILWWPAFMGDNAKQK